MRARYLILLTLLLIPSLACFKITPPDEDEYQGVEPLTFSVESEIEDESIYLDRVEVVFDTYINFTSLGTGTCVDKREEDDNGILCKRVIWEYTEYAVGEKDELDFTLVPDFCLEQGTYLNLEILVNGKCPEHRIERRLYSDAFTASPTTGVKCGPFHQTEAQLKNVSAYAYYRPLGGNATLYISGVGQDEEIIEFSDECEDHLCGEYDWYTEEVSMSSGFRLCAEAEEAELMVGKGQKSVEAWWDFTTMNRTTEQVSESLLILGRPKFENIEIRPDDILEQQSLVFRAGVTATCGDIDEIEIGLDARNVTCKKWEWEMQGSVRKNVTYYESCDIFEVTSPNVTLRLNNTDSVWAEFSVRSLSKGETSFVVFGSYEDASDSKETENITIEYNPLKCERGFQRCDGVCKEVPNCTRPCMLGVICEDGNLKCLSRECGTPCPNDPDNYCDGHGYCLPPQKQGYPCDCDEICANHYMDSGVCLHSVTCDGACRYVTRTCSKGTCTAHGCCGDGYCDEGEDCGVCPEDCSCDDDNPCTIDTCSQGVCVYENQTCGVTCPEGLCDGLGECRPDACCSDEDCGEYACKNGTCKENTCQFELFTCISCDKGWCKSGKCVSYLKLEEDCECDVSCGPDRLCVNGKCSTCGNDVCNSGECYTCLQDCELGFCAQVIWDEHGLKLIIGILLLGFVIWYLQTLIPDLKEFLRKSKPKPPNNY